jgi:hypothetical protein
MTTQVGDISKYSTNSQLSAAIQTDQPERCFACQGILGTTDMSVVTSRESAVCAEVLSESQNIVLDYTVI